MWARIVSEVQLDRWRSGSARIKSVADIAVYQSQDMWQAEIESEIGVKATSET